MSINLSNKSLAFSHQSSTSSDEDKLPRLITVEEHLPLFAEATTANLPHTIITSEDNPPSFCLSVTTQEAKQEFPSVSPHTVEILLCMHPNINKAIHTVTFGLIATIHHC